MIAPEHILVRVIQRRPLAESPATSIGNTIIYSQGDTFETTPERAAALGDAVERVIL